MNYEEIKKLIDDMGNSKLDSLEVEFPDGIKISMTKKETKEVSIASDFDHSKEEIKSIETEESKVEENLKVIKSPMVGTFYESSSPEAEPFVKKGDKVKKGQVLCIIEAMKLMNEIESELDGEIVEICAKNEEVIEYGMPLFKIK